MSHAALHPHPRIPDAAPPAAFFQEHGYYVARGLYRAEEMALLEADFDRICAQILRAGEGAVNARWQGEENDRLGRDTKVYHAKQLHMFSPRWLSVWQDARFADLAAALLGSEDVVLHHTKLFAKPAEQGASFPAHQDWSYFPTEHPAGCIAGILCVSPCTNEMGCLRVFPGSHREGRISDSRGLGQISELQRRFPIEQGLPVEGQPGDVVFFSSLTVHGSLTNRSSALRKTVLAQIYDGRDWIDPAVHPNARIVLRGWGHRMTAAAAER